MSEVDLDGPPFARVAGISGLHRNAAVAIVADGELAAFCEQERIVRTRGVGIAQGGFPRAALDEAARVAGVSPGAIDAYAAAEDGVPLPDAARHVRLSHHFGHAATAFLTSTHRRAAVVVCDRTAPEVSVWIGDERGLRQIEWEWQGPGFASTYAAIAEAFGLGGSEHKLEELARLGSAGAQWAGLRPERAGLKPGPDDNRGARGSDLISGSSHGLELATDFTQRVADLARIAHQKSEHVLAALAAELQARLGQLLLDVIRDVRVSTGNDALCLGGGLFFNTSLNTMAQTSDCFRDVFVPVNPGNGGLAAGAALATTLSDRGASASGLGARASGLADVGGPKGQPYMSVSPFLGPEYSTEEIKAVLDNCKLTYEYFDERTLISRVVDLLQAGRLVGWFQGRMEWGVRALGNRSILASPLSPYVLENLNVFLKRREGYRSYGVAVEEDARSGYFDGPPVSRFMEYEYDARESNPFAALMPAGPRPLRVQTVGPDAPQLRRLLAAFGSATGHPVLVNTSFNGFHEPIVCSPRDAIRVFYGTGLDALAIGPFLLEK